MLDWIEYYSFQIYELAFVVGMGLLCLDVIADLIKRRMDRLRFFDTLMSLATQLPYYFTEAAAFSMTIFLYYHVWYETALIQLPVNYWTVAVVIILCDLGYYLSHLASHKVRLFWLAHAVHHSSPVMNTAVAFRFSPLDPFISPIFHLPLVFFGFNPILVLAGEVVVLAYQFWLHTELVGKLGPLDKVLNTPSNHRVHHGSNEKYLDKNMGGITVIWDRLFGTYQAEEETPEYGLVTPIKTVNPIKVWFSEFPQLFRDLKSAQNLNEVMHFFLAPPGWKKEE